MPLRQGWMTGLDLADQVLVEDALALVRDADIDGVLAGVTSHLTQGQRDSFAARCDVSHAAVLVFPPSIDDAVAEMRAHGLTVDDPVPSVVVRDRLARRYGLPVNALDVGIVYVHVPVADRGSRMVELFVLEVPPGSELADIAERERLRRDESHLALDVRAPDDVIMAGLRGFLVDQAALMADGGGYNAFEDRTVLYFRNPDHPDRRLEIRARGHWAAVLAAHAPSTTVDDQNKRLLTLMTGAWTTQAITVAAELNLADELARTVPEPVGELADRLTVDRDGLARLLRYLESLGLVTSCGDAYTLTALGEPLRRDARHSLRPLALMYGGPFYQSFGMLAHAVRTGQDGFAQLFGQGHFDYFAERPLLAELFDDAMAASAPMLGPVAELADFTDAHVVVDVAGGNGELLGRVLAHEPHLRGVLFEREHVLGRARQRLADVGVADRCEFVAGDFTEFVPAGGDIYLLSRVLHDWDDERCRTILRRCAASIRPGGRLLIVERLLRADGRPSLADAWDLHMLCNVGGRERTAAHYERLLAAAGFTLVAVSDLPLDASLLHARRNTTPVGPQK